MVQPKLTLLIEDLGRLAVASSGDMRFPALERAWARGEDCSVACATANHLRFMLFGIDPQGDLPIAALTHVTDRKSPSASKYFWLRADPVTMWADMARVVMTRHGFADLDPYERNEIEILVRSVLQEEGIDLHADHPERWCIALEEPLQFSFTPLDEALGMDVGDALPDHPEARYWRRILNEIQVALHNCPVNKRRRARGQTEVNSVWFWGGGFLPEATHHYAVDTVYSDHPVSRGLAIINDSITRPQLGALDSDFRNDGQAVLIDWACGPDGPAEELAAMEALVGRLLDLAERSNVELKLYDGSGAGRFYDAAARRRFWRVRRSLQGVLAPESSA